MLVAFMIYIVKSLIICVLGSLLFTAHAIMSYHLQKVIDCLRDDEQESDGKISLSK